MGGGGTGTQPPVLTAPLPPVPPAATPPPPGPFVQTTSPHTHRRAHGPLPHFPHPHRPRSPGGVSAPQRRPHRQTLITTDQIPRAPPTEALRAMPEHTSRPRPLGHPYAPEPGPHLNPQGAAPIMGGGGLEDRGAAVGVFLATRGGCGLIKNRPMQTRGNALHSQA